MIYKGLNRTGMIGDIKTHGGGEIAEVYGGIGESDPIYYKLREMVGTSPMQFKALGFPLKDYHIYGETLQDGTPSPDYPVDVVGVGEWDGAANSYKIPVTTTNGTDTVTTPIYVGAEPLHRIGEYTDYVDYAIGKIVRKIKKLVLTGEEAYTKNYSQSTNYLYYAPRSIFPGSIGITPVICNELPTIATAPIEVIGTNTTNPFPSVYFNFGSDVMNTQPSGNTAAGLKEYLAAQYAAGTPVTVWYVLQESIEEDPPVPFPELSTLAGTNTLTVDTTVKPSEIDLTGRLKTSGYGQLLDKDLTAINDSTGTPIFIRG